MRTVKRDNESWNSTPDKGKVGSVTILTGNTNTSVNNMFYFCFLGFRTSKVKKTEALQTRTYNCDNQTLPLYDEWIF